MKSAMFRWIGIGMILAMLAGCAHRKDVRAGDAAMEAGAYTEALAHYRSARDKKPRSETIQDKFFYAEEMVLRVGLKVAEDRLADGDVEGALEAALDTVVYLESPARLERFEGFLEDEVAREGRRRKELGEFAEGLWILNLHFEAFGEPKAGMARLREEIFDAWVEDLTTKGRADRESGRYGAAAARYAVASWLDQNENLAGEARSDIARVRAEYGWRVHFSGNMEDDSLRRIIDQGFAVTAGGAIFDGRQRGDEGLTSQVRLTLSEPGFEDWEERETRSQKYQSGTQLVANPQYLEARERWERADGEVREGERSLDQAWRDLREAERELRTRQREGRPTSLAESRVDRANREIDRWEAEVARRVDRAESLFREKRSLPTHVEEPVYSNHYYEVVRQRARMRTEIRLEIVVPEVEFDYVLEKSVVEEGETVRHTQQPVINLGGRNEPKPTRSELRRSLDGTLGDEVGAFLLDALDQVRRRNLGNLESLEEAERLNRLAVFLLLDPENRDWSYEELLNQLAGFDDSANLLVGLTEN